MEIDERAGILYSEETELRKPYTKVPANPEPKIIYENHRGLLEKYTKPVIKKLYDFYRKSIGDYPYLNNIRIRIQKLPTYWAAFFKKTSEGIKIYLRPIGKIFGAKTYDTNEVIIDPSVIPESGDKEREILKRYGLSPPRPERVIGEELIHADQIKRGVPEKYRGRLGKRYREYLEGAAASISDYLFGETGIYRKWKEKFRSLARSSGLRKAYLGVF